jgi:hypothetical protein
MNDQHGANVCAAPEEELGWPRAKSWIKLIRSYEVQQLLRDPLAFTLLTVIALRARWRRSGFDVQGLQLGEALIGDYSSYGMSRRQYRTRLERLEKWGLITTRRTRHGTIARLVSSSIFDINQGATDTHDHQIGQRDSIGSRHVLRPTNRPAIDQEVAVMRPLTKKEKKKERITDAARATKFEMFRAANDAAGLHRRP